MPLIVCCSLAGIVKLCEINVTDPVVFTDRFVKLLLPIDVVRFVLATVMNVIVPLAATVWPKVLKLLLLIFRTLVALAEPEG